MITSPKEFVKYFRGLRRRTTWVLDAVPPDKADWAPAPGEFTPVEIVRHLASTVETYTTIIEENRWTYSGHGPELGRTWPEALAYLEKSTEACLARLEALPADVLREKRDTMGDRPISAWRFLTLMVEHEVHHRSQLATYLTLMGIEPPQMAGMKIEEIAAEIVRRTQG
jgi:uncharacterized damage-inducible protein DinB